MYYTINNNGGLAISFVNFLLCHVNHFFSTPPLIFFFYFFLAFLLCRLTVTFPLTLSLFFGSSFPHYSTPYYYSSSKPSFPSPRPPFFTIFIHILFSINFLLLYTSLFNSVHIFPTKRRDYSLLFSIIFFHFVDFLFIISCNFALGG